MTLAIVTGSSAGLGFHTALGLARNGHNRVVVTSRTMARAIEACQRLTTSVPECSFLPYELRLHDLDHVQAFADRVTAELGNWDVLVNNAGAKVERPIKFTAQGFEWHHGVNHLAHFALTSWLKSHAAPNARVVCNASIVARRGEQRTWREPEKRSAASQYAGSKLANLCFALELNSRGILAANAAHPGFARAEPYGNRIVRFAEYLAAQSAAKGAQPLVAAADANQQAGLYLGPRIFELWGKPTSLQIPEAANAEARRYLWQLSEEQLGFAF